MFLRFATLIIQELRRAHGPKSASLSNGKDASDEMRDLRTSVSAQCAASGLRERGIYQLSVPTGGGKTLSSLRFALTHAKKHRMDRIIYVIHDQRIAVNYAGQLEVIGPASVAYVDQPTMGAARSPHGRPSCSRRYRLCRWAGPWGFGLGRCQCRG